MQISASIVFSLLTFVVEYQSRVAFDAFSSASLFVRFQITVEFDDIDLIPKLIRNLYPDGR